MFHALVKDLMQSRPGAVWKPYIYASAQHTLDAAANLTVNGSIEAIDEKDFIWTHGLYNTSLAAIQNGTDTTFGGLLFKLDEIGGQGQGGKTAFMLESLFGRGGLSGGPRQLPIPVMFSGKSTIGYSLTNLTAGAVNVRLDFIGLKRY